MLESWVYPWENMGMSCYLGWTERGRPETSSQVVHHLNLHGPIRPHLYALILQFLTPSDLLPRHTADIRKVLEHIEREKITPPLTVIQVLSRGASVELVKQ
jgi:hypothetical protein